MDRPKFDASKVNYHSPIFHKGFEAGKTGRSGDCPDTISDEDYHTWVEAWLMGEAERGI